MEASNEDYPRKNWSSVMLINCAHFTWRQVNPDFVQRSSGSILHRFAFMVDDEIGELPKEWNFLVGECSPSKDTKLAHFTLGGPWCKHYSHCEYSAAWFEERGRMEFVSV
jgi:hypothetical protein